MKKTGKIILAVLVVVLIAGAIYINPLLPIITGYAAKNLASGIFVAGRTQESLEATDLNFSFIKYTKNKVDYENKTVKSSFLWKSAEAMYIDGYGCTLLSDGTTPEDIAKLPFSPVEVLPKTPDTIAWPMGNLIADTIPSGIDMEKLNTALDMAFADTVPHKGTFAVAIAYKNQFITERYKDGLSAENKFLSWSMAKSFTNALTGILVKQGRLDINQPLNIDEWQNDDRKNITLNNLMHMNSGLEWNEDYGNSSDVNIMLHEEKNMGYYTLNKPYKYPADSVWYYSSGSTNIVSKMLCKSIGNNKEYLQFPRKELFNKIGMTSAIFEVAPSGTFIGSSYIYATMKDYVRFALLYMNDGNWLGEQILPEGWVDYTTTEANGSEGQYGAFFWINKSGMNYPDAPRDMFFCDGHDGQFIYMIPSKNLVIVRTGFSKHGEFDYNEFVAKVVSAFE